MTTSDDALAPLLLPEQRSLEVWPAIDLLQACGEIPASVRPWQEQGSRMLHGD